jgi:hypothetical protein
MRFIVDRWYVVPLVAMIALYVCCMIAVSTAHIRVSHSAKGRLDRIYNLARSGNYDDIVRQGLAGQAVGDYLRQQDRLFGPVEKWEINVENNWLSEDFSGTVAVTRTRVKNSDQISGNLDQLTLALDSEQFSGDGTNWGVIKTPEQAMAAARLTIHYLDGDQVALKAERIGNMWLVTESPKNPSHPNYLVLSEHGKPLQHVREGQVTTDEYGYSD